MATFFIFYGLIEAANSWYIYVCRKKNMYNLYVTFIWGMSFVLVGLIEIHHLHRPWNILAYTLFGLTWFPMMFTPCGVSIFRIDKTTMFIRKIIFLIIGVSQFLYVYFM